VLWPFGQNVLFSSSSEFGDELNDHQVPDSLRQAFKDNSAPLSNTVAVSIEVEDSEWIIRDEGNRKTYILRLEEYQLKVYSQTDELLNQLSVTAAKCVLAAAPKSTSSGDSQIPWRIYAAQRYCEPVRDQAVFDARMQLQSYTTVAAEIKGAGEAVDAAVQASWDRDDVLRLLDILDQAVGLAALAVAIDNK
jgi:hypothetical protein